MIELSKRLRQVAEFVPQHSILADIGSDHAYLPLYLVQQGIVRHAIAGEVNPGPFEAARRTVTEWEMTEEIEVRRGDGLQVLTPFEVSAITICGMGGGTIANILRTGFDRLEGVQTLVLQPMNDSESVRRFLHRHDWKITAEAIIEEDEILYEIIVSESGKENYTNELFYKIGNPSRMADPSLYHKKVEWELWKVNGALQGVQKSQNPLALSRLEELLRQKSLLEGVLLDGKGS